MAVLGKAEARNSASSADPWAKTVKVTACVSSSTMRSVTSTTSGDASRICTMSTSVSRAEKVTCSSTMAEDPENGWIAGRGSSASAPGGEGAGGGGTLASPALRKRSTSVNQADSSSNPSDDKETLRPNGRQIHVSSRDQSHLAARETLIVLHQDTAIACAKAKVRPDSIDSRRNPTVI